MDTISTAGPPTALHGRFDQNNVCTLFHDRSCCKKCPVVPHTLSHGLVQGAPSTGRQVVCAGCISTVYELWGCIPPSIKVVENICDMPQAPPCAEITAHAFLGAVAKDQKERTKTVYSLDIDTITMLLRTPANHHALNRFLYSMSRIGRTTSRCTARRRVRVRPWTFRAQNTWITEYLLNTGQTGHTKNVNPKHFKNVRLESHILDST